MCDLTVIYKDMEFIQTFLRHREIGFDTVRHWIKAYHVTVLVAASLEDLGLMGQIIIYCLDCSG